MRKNIKDQINNLLRMLLDLHRGLLTANNVEYRNQLLQNAQKAALSIGTTIEEMHSNPKPIISILEKYCDQLFSFAQSPKILPEDISILDTTIEGVKNLIKNIGGKYHVVFMPYKAAMWDSLESIWQAFDADDNCSTHIVPIPFYEYEAATKKWEYRYDGNLFPKDIPIIDYNNYSLENNQPDMIFIHNPYDNMNSVVSIHPDYLSKRLKQFTNCLVYVPYYVTSGFVAPEQLHLPVHQNMDIMIIQSEYAKEQYKDYPHYSKIIPLGSPKLDRVINACKHKPDIPKEWQKIIANRKIIMLNTSINSFLHTEDNYLNKIYHVCSSIVKNKDVALIWRPHPLLEATIISMRPMLKKKFLDLKNWFIKSGVGILDSTPDVTKTVALADAYIGEESSSVINLFTAVGKPIFVLNNFLTEEFTTQERHYLEMRGICYDNKYSYFTSPTASGIFRLHMEDKKIKHIGFIDGESKWNNPYSWLSKVDQTIYLSPFKSYTTKQYDIPSEKYQTVSDKEFNKPCMNGTCINYGDKIFYLPFNDGEIREYNTKTKTWKSHTTCIDALIGEKEKENRNRVVDYTNFYVSGSSLWIVAEYTNRVLEFYMEDTSYFCIHYIGCNTQGYSSVVVDNEKIWLIEAETGSIIACDKQSKEITTIDLPQSIVVWMGHRNRKLSFGRLFDMVDVLIALPSYSNSMLRIDKTTGEITCLLNEFWNPSSNEQKGFNPKYMPLIACGVKLNNDKIFTQRRTDLKAIIYDVKNDTYEEFFPEISEETFKKFIEEEDGFEKTERDRAFYRTESRIFTLNGFLNDLVSGKLDNLKERQLDEMHTMATNMDGTCGEKVHDYLINLIESR